MTLFAASAYHLYAARSDGSAERFFVPGDLDLDIHTRPSLGPNIFPANLVQICSAIPGIFDSETKKSQTALKPTLGNLLRAVNMLFCVCRKLAAVGE